MTKNTLKTQYDVECTASGKAKGGAESTLKPVTYRPQQIRKSTSCLGGCGDRRGSAVSSFLH